MTGFVLARVRAHRLLLAAALLTVLLTTAVLATLTAYSGAIGDAALRHSLDDPRNAADTSLVVKAEVPYEGRTAADSAVRKGARRVFDGLPLTVRTLTRSGPYALPGRTDGSGDPDLTFFAALDTGQVRLVSGRMPGPAAGTDVEVALPQTAARQLGLRPGSRLTLTDRLDGPAVRVRVTGLYRPADVTAPYWQLDDLLGRGIKKSGFTTYGPLLADPAVLGGRRVSAGTSAWLASAGFAAVTTGHTDTLRRAARSGVAALRKDPALTGMTASTTSLPDVLDRVDRSLRVARSTLLIVTLQLTLLAGYALLLVARLLSAERREETRLLRARGASGTRIAGLAAAEASLLAVPAAVCAPLLAGPLTQLLAGEGALARIDLRLEVPAGGRGTVWLVAAASSLTCALAVTLAQRASFGGTGLFRHAAVRRPVRGAGNGAAGPHSAAGTLRTVRRPALASSAKAGADLGLLTLAAVAYWQLRRHPAGATDLDPLLIAAPALALLAGTVLTLRLLPPLARLAERRAAAGRGLSSALAAWQFGRRPARNAPPVLLLVLAVALGMLAIGQATSWTRSQDDQADFAAGAPVRVLAAGDGGLGRTDIYAALPGVHAAAPAVRTTLPLSGDRTATVLALDTAHAADTVLMRRDLADRPVRPLLAGLAAEGGTAGARIPAHTARLDLTASVRSSTGPGTSIDVTVTLENRYGVPYRLPFGRLPTDGRPHTLTLDLTTAPGPATLTGLQLDMAQPAYRAEQHRLRITGLTATGTDGTATRLPLPAPWTASALTGGAAVATAATSPGRPHITSTRPLTVDYGTGYLPDADIWTIATVTIRLYVTQPAPPELTALATDRFLDSANARPGERVDVTIGGETLPVRITAAVRALPTTGDNGGALLLDLRSVNRQLAARYGQGAEPTEWWLGTSAQARTAAAVRALPDVDPGEVVVRDEIDARLRDDPFGAGPEAAFVAAAVVAAALAAVGFAVSAAGSLRERDAEFAVLRALGAPRRRLARAVAAELGVLVGLALVVGVALGTVLTRTVLPLIVLTSRATRPVPELRVALPPGQVALLLAAVAAAPLAVTIALSRRGANPASALRDQGAE
ncbi:FtsX-like permease family protein [Streptomyces sp. NPDC059467]|uniref:FtsX-like permease family protein n=1 Tax=Streptomyces sp. NPDC059467 TaxID=3346844 RepID=UPI0036C98B28